MSDPNECTLTNAELWEAVFEAKRLGDWEALHRAMDLLRLRGEV